MLTRRIFSDACTLFILLTLAACTGSNHVISQVSPEPALPANDTPAQVDNALEDFFADIDHPRKQ